MSRPFWLWFVPTVSLFLTAAAWHATRVSTQAGTAERFRFRTEAFAFSLQQIVSNHEHMLRGIVGLFDAGGPVAPSDWNAYLTALQPESSTRGLESLGYRLEPRAAAAQAEPDSVTVYTYPPGDANRNGQADRESGDPVRLEAMMRARETGAAAMSGFVHLPSSETATGWRPGMVLYLPVYGGGGSPRTAADRRAALRGFVYGAFRADALIESVFRAQHWEIDVEIYDGRQGRTEDVLYRSAPERRLLVEASSAGPLAYWAVLEMAGRQWLFVAAPSRTFVSQAERYLHWLIAAGGLAITALVSIGMWASSMVRQRALVLAQGMAEAAQASDEQTQLMIDSITDHALFRLDEERNVTSWNAAAERILGYEEAEILSTPASQFWVGNDGNPYTGDDGVTDRQTREGWHVRKDGRRFWGAAAVAPLHGPSGTSGFVVILRDDTNRRRAMEALAETSAELEKRTIELGRFNRLASGREMRMIELKRMVNERSVRLGMEPPFDLSFADGFADITVSSGEAS